MKKLWFYITTEWQLGLPLFIAAIAVGGLLVFRLGSLAPGAHISEIDASQTSTSYKSVFRNPVSAPFFVTRNTILKIAPDRKIIAARLVSAVVVLASAAALFWLLSMWYKPRIAILGTVLFVTSSWVLRLGRIGLPDSMQLLSVLLIVLWVVLQRSTNKRLALLATCLVVASALYIPGLVWLVAIALLWRARTVWKQIRTAPIMFTIIGIVLSSLLIAPLVYSVTTTQTTIDQLSALSPGLTFNEVFGRLMSLPGYLAVKGPPDSRLTVGSAPILDVFVVTAVVIGIISAVRNWRLDRNKLSLGLLLFGMIYSAVTDMPMLALLVAPVYLLAVEGIAYLLEEWMRVFPRNPLARDTAVILITIAVLFVAFYNINNYFIAWPNAPTTRTEFNHQL